MKKYFLMLILLSSMNMPAGQNLLPNGNFDQGKDAPLHWDKDDKLTSFWLNDPKRGRILKLDTRVQRKQVLDWWEELKNNPGAKAPQAIIPSQPLAAIGANEGSFIDSEMIDVKKGQNYKLTVDYKGPVEPFVWIKGFMFHPVRKFYIDCYQTRLVPKKGDPEVWRTFSIGFNPSAKMPRVVKMKVRVYAYWPVAVNYFDNVRIEEIGKEEMADLVKQRSEK